MSAPVRVAVIGGGFARSAITPAYARHRGVEVIATVSSRDLAEVAAVCARTDVDLVSVHAAPHQHREIVDRVLDAGHHVACDKPFGANLADAEHLAARARGHDGLAAVTFEFRYERWRSAVRDLLAAGGLGDLESVDWVEHHPAWRQRDDWQHGGGWQLSRAQGGGWMGAMAAHTIDTLGWWGGPVGVLAASHDGDDAQGVAERACELSLRVGTGRAMVVARGASTFTSGPRVLIAGSAGAIEWSAGSLTAHGLSPSPSLGGPERSFPELLDAWCADVVRAIGCGGEAAPQLAGFDAGLAWARVRHEALAAAQAGSPAVGSLS